MTLLSGSLGPSAQMLVSDLDGTLLGNPEATRRFRRAWDDLPKKTRPLLVYATGRLVQDVIDMLAGDILPWPDYIIGGVGTQIYDGLKKRSINEYRQHFQGNWNLTEIERIVGSCPGIARQPAEFLHQFKSRKRVIRYASFIPASAILMFSRQFVARAALWIGCALR